MGDGFRLALSTISLVLAVENGTIIIEEPEVHQHPGSMKLVAESIVSSAKRNNQIFISTHSLEFLEMLLKKSIEEKANVNIFKFIDIEDGKLKYKRYNLEEAYSAINKIGLTPYLDLNAGIIFSMNYLTI